MYSRKRRCKMYQQAIYIDPQASPRRAGRYVISIPLFASLLFFASLANAQQFVEIQRASRDASGRKTPVIADITLQTTWITPWGTYTQSLKGKYWRSRDGKNRQDDSFGTSYLLTPKSEIWIDRELQTIAANPPGQSVFPSHLRVAGLDLGKQTLFGRTVEGYRIGLEAYLIDFWLDSRLGIPIQIRHKSGAFESVQQLENIEERDPDPTLFEIPEGFSVVTCVPSTSKGRKQPSKLPAACGLGTVKPGPGSVF